MTTATIEPDLFPMNCPGCGRLAYFRYANAAEALKGTPLCWDDASCPGRRDNERRIPKLCREDVLVPCGACKGTGTVPAKRLSEALAATGRDEWRSTKTIAKALGISLTNAANMMRELFDLGLVERRGTGARTPYEWRRKGQSDEA